MRDVEINRLFKIAPQSIQNWKNGRSGEGKRELYRLIAMLDADKVRSWLKQDSKDILADNLKAT